MTSLAPFVLGATPAGQVIVPAGADPFTIGYFAQLNTLYVGAAGLTRASIALTAGGFDGAAGTAVSTPLLGTGAMVPTAIVARRRALPALRPGAGAAPRLGPGARLRPRRRGRRGALGA